MTDKLNPINIWNKHKYADGDNEDRHSEQRSSSIDQGNTGLQAQREPVNVLPNDFGSNIIREQDSDFKNDSEDMISRNKKPNNYNLFNMKSEGDKLPDYQANVEPTHSKDINFFGDSNVARRTSRSTLDQEGLHRGNISTLPSAGTARRQSLRQHANDPDVKSNNSTLLGRTKAAVATSLGAAASLGVSQQLRDKSKQENTAMPSTWPDSPKANEKSQFVEPAIHGQTACYKHNDPVCDTITDSDKHSFCDRVQEPSIHGQTPSFYQNNVNNNSVNNQREVQQSANVNNNNSTEKPSPARRLSNSIGNLFGKSSTTTKEKTNEKSIWSAGNTMDTSNSKKGLVAGAGIGAGIGGLLSRKNQVNDFKSTNANQLVGTNNNTNNVSKLDDKSITESTDELPKTWGDQSTPVVLDDKDPLSRPHAADRAFATQDFGHPNSSQDANNNSTHAQIVHNDADPNADHSKMGFDKKSSAAAGILGGAGIGATVGSLLSRDKKQSTDSTTANKVDQRDFATATSATKDENNASTHTQVMSSDVDPNADHAKMGFDKKSSVTTDNNNNNKSTAFKQDDGDQIIATPPVSENRTTADPAQTNDHAKSGGIGAGILGGAGIGAAVGSLLGHNKKNTQTNDITTTTVAGVEQKAFGNNEQQAFGGNSAFGNTPAAVTSTSGVAQDSISPLAKENAFHNALHISKNNTTTQNNESNTKNENEPSRIRRWSTTTITTPEHHVEKRLAVGGIMGATANAEGRRVLNKLYPENSHWDSNAPIVSRLGEVEITDQPRRRSSVSETLGNIFGINKTTEDNSAIQRDTIQETNGLEPVTGLTPNSNYSGNESISSTRATRGVIIPDRSNEVKNRSAHQNFANVPDSALIRDAPTSSNNPNRNSFTQGIAAASGSISNAVRRLSRRKSSIDKDSIKVRHLSEAEVFKKQALGDKENTNSAVGGTVPVHSDSTVPVQNNNLAPLTDSTNNNDGNINSMRRGSTASSEHLKYTGVQKGYARIPGVHTLKPSENDVQAPTNNESFFIKEANPPTVGTLVSGHMETRRGSIQKAVGKLFGSESMQDQGALKEVAGQSKINAYNTARNSS